jgi:nucleoside 2-deoxyribosyltransferase
MSTIDTDPCEVCTSAGAQTRSSPSYFDGVHQVCPRCGEFKLSGSAGGALRRGVGPGKRALLSGYVREQNNSGSVPTITSKILANVLQRSLPSLADRSFSLLKEAEKGLTALGETFNINEPRFLASSYSAHINDVHYLIRMLSSQGLVKSLALDGTCEILPVGYMKLDELRGPQSSSARGFIAMSFDPSMNDVYEMGFQSGVLAAGFDPLRIDRHEHINRIDDEIIRQINASRFVVADFSGHRGGVYFEAGYALGKQIPVFWTCKKSDMENLHFDIRQFNCIDWETPQSLSERLAARIEAVLGAGPNKSIA